MDGTIESAEIQDSLPLEKQCISEREDFERLVHEQWERLRGLAWHFGVGQDDLDDVTQEILIRAWAARKSFRGQSQAATWLIRIALNYLTSRRRTLARRLKLIGHPVEKFDICCQSPSMEAADNYRQVQEAISRLPVKLRKVLVLRYFEDMSCAEVATVLEIPESTVRTRVYHGRRKLRAMLEANET